MHWKITQVTHKIDLKKVASKNCLPSLRYGRACQHLLQNFHSIQYAELPGKNIKMQAELFTCWHCSHSLFKDCTAPFLSLGHFRYFHLFCGVFCGLQGPQVQLTTGHVVPCKRIISILGLQTKHTMSVIPLNCHSSFASMFRSVVILVWRRT